MTITRPYGAEDNEINSLQREILTSYTNRDNEEISTMEIYGASVTITTTSGRKIVASKAEGCMARTFDKRNYIFLKEVINGKSRRIPKSEW